MRVIAGTKIRAIENYESKKEKWLLQVAADSELSAGARHWPAYEPEAAPIGLARIWQTAKAARYRPQHSYSRSEGVRAPGSHADSALSQWQQE
jgi:hypothetical protein